MTKRHFVSTVVMGSMLLLAGVGCNNSAPQPTADQPTDQTNSAPAPADTTGAPSAAPTTADSQGAPPPATTATGQVKEFTMTAKNWQFDPASIMVHKGDTVRIKITSLDRPHGFELSDFNINVMLDPGNTQVVEFVADKVGTFNFRCSVPCGPGHRDMRGVLIVQ